MDHLARNSDGDQLLFVHEGSGDLYCDYGRLPFGEGDFIQQPTQHILTKSCCLASRERSEHHTVGEPQF